MALAADYLERAAELSARPAAVHLQQIQVKILDHAARPPRPATPPGSTTQAAGPSAARPRRLTGWF